MGDHSPIRVTSDTMRHTRSGGASMKRLVSACIRDSLEGGCILAVRDAGWSSQVARWAHNPEVAGSNPAPATTKALVRGPFSFPEHGHLGQSRATFGPVSGHWFGPNMSVRRALMLEVARTGSSPTAT